VNEPARAGQPGASLAARLAEFTAAIDEYAQRLITSAELPADLDGMLRYHLGWVDEQFRPVTAPRGKHLRPALCLLTCEGAGGRWQAALPAATAVELIHNFSLVHDDIEDESPLRRHRPTLWALWGVPRALNAGDTLFVLAQLALLGDEGLADLRYSGAQMLNRSCIALCSGQHRDLAVAAGAEPTLAGYLAMIGGKTAALLGAACELGALAARTPATARSAYASFGRAVGLAFQLQDDLLDVWGSATQTGKPAREDLRARKHSLPIVLAYQLASAADRTELGRLYEQPAPLPDPALQGLVARMETLGVRQEGERLVRELYEVALAALDAAQPQAQPRKLLRQLADSLIGRQA
jgi:geranylgeranyl diphosphate synthase, type I